MRPFTNVSVEQEVEIYTKTVEHAKSKLINNLVALKSAVLIRTAKTYDAISALEDEAENLKEKLDEVDEALNLVKESK